MPTKKGHSDLIPSLTFAGEIRDALAQLVASCISQATPQFAVFVGNCFVNSTRCLRAAFARALIAMGHLFRKFLQHVDQWSLSQPKSGGNRTTNMYQGMHQRFVPDQYGASGRECVRLCAGFWTPDDEGFLALLRPASKKRQGTKSR
jgi:hypothetical protein